MLFQLMTSFISNVSLAMFKQKHLIKYILNALNLYDISEEVLCKDKYLNHVEDIFMNMGQIYMLWHQPDTSNCMFCNIEHREHYGIYYDIVKKIILDTRD